MKLSLALIAMTGIALGQDDATTTTAPTANYDDYDYASLDGFGRGKGGKKKAEREKAKAECNHYAGLIHSFVLITYKKSGLQCLVK